MILTDACRRSSGKIILSKDCESRKLVSRVNAVNQLICDVERRINNESAKLARYCEIQSSSSESSSSSSSFECLTQETPCIPDFGYIITVNDLSADVHEIVSLLEQEACALLRKLIGFEKLNNPPTINNSSSSSSSSESSSSSVSSSSSEISSSSL